MIRQLLEQTKLSRVYRNAASAYKYGEFSGLCNKFQCAVVKRKFLFGENESYPF